MREFKSVQVIWMKGAGEREYIAEFLLLGFFSEC